MTNKWIPHHRPRPGTQLRLFCFPYAGGRASIFQGWINRLPSAIEVIAVELPGHGARLTERPHHSLAPLVGEVTDALLPWLDRPFAFFGHSMGALISFELARLLEAEHGLAPYLLMVSAHHPPQLPRPGTPLYPLDDDEFISRVRRLNGTPPQVFDEPELIKLLLPILRADFTLCERYRYREGSPLTCPIVALGGRQDPMVEADTLTKWREQTSSSFIHHLFAGGHFFIQEAEEEVLALLTDYLYPVRQML